MRRVTKIDNKGRINNCIQDNLNTDLIGIELIKGLLSKMLHININ